MHGLYHPFSKALYERNEDGTVTVTDGELQGRFGANGAWIEGELRECDPQLCGWIAGPQFANHRMGGVMPSESAS